MSFDIPGTIQVVRDRRGVLLSIPGAMQKNRQTQEIPTTPGFAELLELHPTQKGWVFDLPRERGRSQRISVTQAERVVSKIGGKAGVTVNASDKSASAHDLRRSLGQRLANSGVSPRDLQKMMRHSSLSTTEKHYLRDDARDIGQRVNARLYPDTVPNSEATVSAFPE